ncbi:MAG TPA: 4a-hydroxytetrahydrobiopterin dehydratase [Longimicrobiales bacterium]|jgi:4a-hydroxytetrahydrobiopterin dehydratase|nr:4a-hydroxytetrahydrobiopterin dehydratase [Longimicrobiales bacterium]
MSDLAERSCVPCNADTPPLEGRELQEFRQQVHDRWQVVDDHHLQAEVSFDDFRGALDFTDRVGEVAEEEGHHPEICLTWGEARLKLWTHAIDGLSENDFILAAKIDEILG